MALPEEELRENLVRLGQVSETLAAAWGKGSKSATARMIAEKNLTDTLIRKGIVEKDAAAAVAKRIIEEEREAARAEQRNKAMADAFGKAIDGAMGLASGAISAQQAAYGASDVFQAVTPTLDLLGNAAKAVADVLATATSGIPFFGGAMGAAAKAAAMYVDISTQVAKAQFENASKYVKTYQELTKAGVTFGGDIKAMQESAKAAGMSLDTYSKFVISNIENLAALGGGTQLAAERVMKMGKSISADQKLFMMFGGNIEEFSGAIAGFHAQLTRYGTTLTDDEGQLTAATKQYLYNLKEVSELTGMSAETQRKEAEARSRYADYNIEMARLGPKVAGNIENSLDIASSFMGKQVSDLAAEFVARKGNVISLEAQQTRAFAPVASRVAIEMAQMAKDFTGTPEELRKAQVDLMKQNRDELMKEAEANAAIGSNARATKDAIQQQFNDLAIGVIQGVEKIRRADEARIKIEGDKSKKSTAEAKDFVSAVNELQKFQIRMDEQTAKSFGHLATSSTKLLEITERLNKLFGNDSQSFTTAVNKLIAALELIAGEATGKPAGPVAPGPDNKGAAKYTYNQNVENLKRSRAISGKAPVLEETKARILSSTGKEYSGNQAELLTDSLKIFNKNLKIKPGALGVEESGAKRSYDSRLADYLNKWSSDAAGGFGIEQITGLNDDYHHKNDKTRGSRHKTGQAVDFTLTKPPTPDEGAVLIEYLKKLGFRYARDEYNNPSDGATGKHIHAELKDGGITKGPSLAGEAGPEAVIPLPDGRTIPVKMDMSSLIEKLEELISVSKDQRDTSEKILRASA
jgi:hypothetical protein